jgi:colicin import membrane protein
MTTLRPEAAPQPTHLDDPYRLTPDGYVALAPDGRGWISLEPAGIWFGIRDNQIVCYDEAGELIGDYATIDTARTEAENQSVAEAQARAEAEARAAATEARLRALEAELRRLRGES